MADQNPAATAVIQVQIAEAKAELAVVLTESFREDINGLRDALQHANQLIATLQTENANLKAALANADPNYTFDSSEKTLGGGEDEAEEVDADGTEEEVDEEEEGEEPAAAGKASAKASLSYTRPDMQCVPPEGTIFSNGGPYCPAQKGERANNNPRLKKELNDWTQTRGYAVKVYRSRLEKKRAKLIISCVLAGRAKYRAGRQETAEEEQRRRLEAQSEGRFFRKQRVSKLKDCPLRFILLEIVAGSGTFVVKHSADASAGRCNHAPAPVEVESDEEG